MKGKARASPLGNLQVVKGEAEFQQLVAEAKGPVLLEFVAEGCPPCEEEKPKLEALAIRWPNITVIRVDVDKVEALANQWKVAQMPTLFIAENGAGLLPGKAKEVENSAAAEEALGALKRAVP